MQVQQASRLSRAAWVALLSPVRSCGQRQTRGKSGHAHKRLSVPRSARPPGTMKVAVVGCAHGELDAIYAALREAHTARRESVDLLICAGDFQAVRNTTDLACMACPPKFRDMRSFYRYYSGEAIAPVPTLFVGGNHEASNHLQEIPLGGLVAPNIYFLGNAGVVSFCGLRIAGVSGVYTEHNYNKPRVERAPYRGNHIKSVYHTRKQDIDRLLRLQRPVDVFISHDWPRGVWNHGNLTQLLKAKPFLRGEIQENSLGNPGTAQLLEHLQPPFWFSAHMHVKFPALVKHHASGKETRFLALDKALPRRDFFQVLDIPVDPSIQMRTPSFVVHDDVAGLSEVGELPIYMDPEWLAILQTGAQQPERNTPVSDEEMRSAMASVREHSIKPFVMPHSDFQRTAPVFDPQHTRRSAPADAALQARTMQLVNALKLPADAWLPAEGGLEAPDSNAIATAFGMRLPA